MLDIFLKSAAALRSTFCINSVIIRCEFEKLLGFGALLLLTPAGWEFLPFPKHRPNHRLYPSLTLHWHDAVPTAHPRAPLGARRGAARRHRPVCPATFVARGTSRPGSTLTADDASAHGIDDLDRHTAQPEPVRRHRNAALSCGHLDGRSGAFRAVQDAY